MPVDIIFNLLLSSALLIFSGYTVLQIFVKDIGLPVTQKLLLVITFIFSGVMTGVNFAIFIKTLWELL